MDHDHAPLAGERRGAAPPAPRHGVPWARRPASAASTAHIAICALLVACLALSGCVRFAMGSPGSLGGADSTGATSTAATSASAASPTAAATTGPSSTLAALPTPSTTASAPSAATATATATPAPASAFWLAPIAADVPTAPSSTDPAQYVREYGFDAPDLRGAGLDPDEVRRLAVMLPFALAATARWNARVGSAIEPQMLLFWTHAEGIGGHISYSNCANETPPDGLTTFQYVANCDTPGFWQLGYGTQFSRVDVLKTAFIDMRGDPDDPALVQRVGQAVLDWDMRQNTVPRCGGYSCRFPALTIDQIMAGVSYTSETEDNWWAAVLARDPAISCYILARTLIFFNHAETQNWVGCYYAEPCWQNESDRLGDVLAAWPALVRAAGI